jgi:hypothetical protein
MTGALNWMCAGALIMLGLVELAAGNILLAALCAMGAALNIAVAEVIARRRA